MYDLKPGQLIECIWIDPAVHADWENAKSVTKCYRFLCRSVGYVHLTDTNGLILTACYGEDLEGEQSLLLQQFLPWGSITDLWILQLEK
ncbi:MAG: hypothetical protein V3V68_05100 [Nitrosomonadaceae bacterium]